MEFYNTETFVNHDKTRTFTFWENEDNEHLMVSYDNHTEIDSTNAKRLRLEDLKHIFNICMDERPRYSVSAIINGLEFYIHLNSPGESRYIIFRKFDRKITVEFKTIGMYIDKSDPNFWVERDYVWEVGNEHKLTCKDLYRIRKMCNISDIE